MIVSVCFYQDGERLPVQLFRFLMPLELEVKSCQIPKRLGRKRVVWAQRFGTDAVRFKIQVFGLRKVPLCFQYASQIVERYRPSGICAAKMSLGDFNGTLIYTPGFLQFS
jgi:hypothetical protein